jgi:hypothetical protein
MTASTCPEIAVVREVLADCPAVEGRGYVDFRFLRASWLRVRLADGRVTGCEARFGALSMRQALAFNFAVLYPVNAVIAAFFVPGAAPRAVLLTMVVLGALYDVRRAVRATDYRTSVEGALARVRHGTDAPTRG